MPIERKLAAIMFTDIAGYTALSAKDETKALNLLDTQKEILTPIIEEFNGILHKEMGDGLLFTFPTVSEAVKCGIKIQGQTKDSEDLNLRIGIHEGEVTLKDGDVLGDDVNVASRIEPFSAVGGIAISGKVQQNISSLTEFETKYIGKPKLKGVSQKVEVYCITSHGLPQTDLSKVSAKLEKESNLTKYALIGGVCVLIAVLFFVFTGEEEKKVPSIAIIPLENRGDNKDEFYSYSISADLISDISSAGDIRVASLKDIEKLDYKSLSNDEIAKKLLVRYISQGTLWKVDSIFQLSMELYDTKKNKIKWSNNWQKNWSELPSIKGGLSENILNHLQVTTKQDITKPETENADAYALYLKAKNIFEKRKSANDTETARQLLQKSIELDNNLLLAKSLLARTYFGTPNLDKAMDISVSTLKQAEQLDDKRGITSCLNMIGMIHRKNGNYDLALEHFKRALTVGELLGNKNGIAAIFNGLGNTYMAKDDFDVAMDYYKKALVIHEEFENKIAITGFLQNLATIYYLKGDIDTALDYIKRALTISEEVGDIGGIGSALYNLATFYYKKIDYDKALDYYKKSLSVEKQLGYTNGILEGFEIIGTIYNELGDYDTALDYFNKLLDLSEEIDYKYGIIRSLYTIGVAHNNKGNYDTALENLEKSLDIQKESEIKDYEFESTIYLYLTYKHLGKQYDVNEIYNLIKEADYIEFEHNLKLYKLLEDMSYLETANSQVQEQTGAMDEKLKAKFLSYPIPKAIVEEWEKVN